MGENGIFVLIPKSSNHNSEMRAMSHSLSNPLFSHNLFHDHPLSFLFRKDFLCYTLVIALYFEIPSYLITLKREEICGTFIKGFQNY